MLQQLYGLETSKYMYSQWYKYFKSFSFNPAFKTASSKICRAKKVYDDTKTIAGCLSTLASGACVTAAIPTGGAAAAFWSATLVYTVNAGLAHCIDGVSDKIANYLEAGPWTRFALKAQIMNKKWSAVIDTAIDNACKDVQ